jgi:hypothetical protein
MWTNISKPMKQNGGALPGWRGLLELQYGTALPPNTSDAHGRW